MLIPKLFFVLLCLIKSCSSNIENPIKDVHEINKNFNSSIIDTNKKTTGLRFRLPFMDMELKTERNLHIIQERVHKQEMYVVHGNELFQMFVGRDEKRLALIGFLAGSVKEMEPLSAEIIDCGDYLLMTIALEEHIEIYQLSDQILATRASATKDSKRINDTAPIFEPVQQISIPGKYRQHFLTDPSKDQIMLIVGINFTKLYGRLHTFAWSNSYFEPIEELTIPPIHFLQVIGSYPKYLVRGRVIKHQTKTIVTVAEIQTPSNTLHTTQTLTVNSLTVHQGSFRGKHYLIACSHRQKECNSFRMNTQGLFSLYKQRTSKELAFDKFQGGEHFLVAAHRNKVLVYTSGRLDCFASFITNETDVDTILTLVNPHGENFILINYKRPFNTLVRMVELESENGQLLGATGLNASEIEDTSTIFRHRHVFEETIGNLRSLLLRQRNAMKVFQKIQSTNQTNVFELKLSHPVSIQGGEIQTVRLVGENLRSPVQLLQRVADLREKYNGRRLKREVTMLSRLSEINTSRLIVHHLNVENLIYQGVVLPGFHLDKSSKPLPILSVRPKLVTKTIETPQILTRNKPSRAHEEKGSSNTSEHVKVLKELNVVTINNVSWQEFYDSLFLKSRDSKINGRLVLQSSSNVTHLTTSVLNNLVVKNIFNLIQPQIVNSNISFTGFLIKDLRAGTVNGIDFANDIVFQNEESFIESAVNMHQLSIEKDLLLSDNVTIQRRSNEDDLDFQQHYTGKVIINGTLTVKNLATEERQRTRVIIDENNFSKQQLKGKFMLGKESQNFTSTIIFGNAKITVPSLETQYLNDNKIEEHLLNKLESVPKNPLLLFFMNARIEGNLECKSMETKLANLSRNAVRNGDIANITGIKIFEAPLLVDHAMTLSLNHLPANDLVLKSQLKQGVKFKDIKSFNELQVDGQTFIKNALNTTFLNKLPLKKFLNQDYHLHLLKVPHSFEAVNIVFHKINDISFDDVFENFKLHDGSLTLHKQLIIEGNVKFGESLNVENINGLNWNAYESNLVRVNENAQITGRKCFLEELTVTNGLTTTTINDLPLETDFERILSKSKPQLIKGNYTFDNLRLSNLDATFINGVSTEEFIDMRRENLSVESDIFVPKLTAFGKLKSNNIDLDLKLKNFTEQVIHLPKQKWQNIFVKTNAYWNDTLTSDKTHNELLRYLYKNTVLQNGKQIISGNIKLIRPLISKMYTTKAFPKDLDLDFLFKDCVLKKSNETQTITATKTFLMALHIRNMEAQRFLGSHLLNTIDILRFNASLYRLSSQKPIVGPLYFRTRPIIGHMIVHQNINGINPALIYHNFSEPLPPLKIQSLYVDEALEINDINNQNFNIFLEKRFVKNSTESEPKITHLTFENLSLNGNIFVETINDISLDNLVFKKSDKLQAVTGTKIVKGKLELAGPAHVVQLNSYDIAELYQETIFKNRNSFLDNLVANDAIFEKGLIVSMQDNQFLGSERVMSAELESSTGMATEIQYRKLDSELQAIENMLSSKKRLRNNFLYLEYAQNWEIICHSTNETINKIYTQQLKRTSICERQYLNVQISTTSDDKNGTIYLSNATTNFITKSDYNLNLKAENYCQQKYRNVKSKITITGSNFTRVIGMKKYIENVIIFKSNGSNDILLIIHAIELSSNRHEVRVLRMPKKTEDNITDWQSLTFGIGRNVRLFKFDNYTALISGGGVIDNQPALVIYQFDESMQKFQMQQTIFGDFDIFDLLPTNVFNEFQLILSCRQCRRIHIYDFKPSKGKSAYEIFQIIQLKSLINKIQFLKLNNKATYMLLLGEHGEHYFYLYRYTQLQGWLHTTYGYFENTELAIPLVDHDLKIEDHNLLLLLCSIDRCSIVKIVIS